MWRLFSAAPRRLAIIVIDSFLAAAAFTLAVTARHDFAYPSGTPVSDFALNVAVMALVAAAVSNAFRVPKGMWGYFGLPDVVQLVKFGVASALLGTFGLALATRLEDVPRTAIVLYPILLIGLTAGVRLLYRLLVIRQLSSLRREDVDRLVLIGIGPEADLLARMARAAGAPDIVGIVALNSEGSNRSLHGLEFLGTCADLPKIIKEHRVDIVVLTRDSVSGKVVRGLVEATEPTGAQFKIIPSVAELFRDRPLTAQLREISLEDLLGREPANLDWETIRDRINGRRVLVTGGAGSIGSELCRQVSRLGPAELIIVDSSEYGLYRADLEFRSSLPSAQVRLVLGDVTDQAYMREVFDQYRPEIVFHAAAYKHVPLLQHQCRTAVRNNVHGTAVVARAASEFGAETFVLISTDKAVEPANVMGATKRVAEAVVSAIGESSSTEFMAVRFGNVLGSTGSVVPLFQEQIRAGGPLTVTHRDATRYFMTIPEACQLILQAATAGKAGATYVLDMGEPVRIVDLAEQMIRLSGLEEGVDIDIEITGLRPGEKLEEELFYDCEELEKTDIADIRVTRSARIAPGLIDTLLAQLEGACWQGEASSERWLNDAITTINGDLLDLRRESTPQLVAGPPQSMSDHEHLSRTPDPVSDQDGDSDTPDRDVLYPLPT